MAHLARREALVATLIRMHRHVLALSFLLFSILAPASAQWEIQNSTTTADLRGIHSVGAGVAWASGTNGTVLRTEDGGYMWQSCSMPPGAEHLDFRGIQAFDTNTAIVMSSGKGDLSRLYKTTDGCHTWKLIFTNPEAEGFWDALELAPEGSGVLIGDPVAGNFAIYESHDHGESWMAWSANVYHRRSAERVKPAQARRGEAPFAASNSAAILLARNLFVFVTGGTGGARLLASEPHNPFDNGTTWRFTATKLPFHSTENSGAFSIVGKSDETSGDREDFMVV